ncbi:hypothetical protein CO151_02880 [bacterium CG_4_9_14_3_um_filter_65_15]|nr:MAG: hypothetical protein CO151_02880 [bacterium CG_4_9_14_3_um_filter_65_15]
MIQTRMTLTLLVILTTIAATAFAVPAAPREFVPVQDGFRPQGTSVLPYAPDRIMVMFTAEAMGKARLNVAMEMGAKAASPSTGIPSVDAILTGVGVTDIVRTYGPAADKAMADFIGLERAFTLQVPEGTDIPAAADRLAADPNLDYAVPDLRAFPATVPNDPGYPDNWGHNNTAQLPGFRWAPFYSHTGAGVGTVGFDTNAENAWNAPTGFGNAVIAILDSGVDTAHPDLNLITGYDFGDGDTNPMDDSAAPGHGTACAGVAAGVADNSVGIAGIAGSCSIMPLKVADSTGAMYFSYIDNALIYAADHGADVVSMSFGAGASQGDIPPTDAALAYAYNNGVTLLAATGNENAGAISYPANHENVIAVGAASPCDGRKRSSSNAADLNPGVSADPNSYTCDGERWWGSNYGANFQDASNAVDFIAPTILPTTDISGSGGYQSGNYEPFFNGTSCATPYAAGVAALVKTAFPSYTPAQIRDRLTTTAIDIINVESVSGWDRYSGYGLVDAEAAVGGGPIAPVADFTADVTSGCQPLTVNFTDLSINSVTNWLWDFGDGATDTLQNPGHTYTIAGSYTVALIATGPAGSDTLTTPNFITVNQPPTADFSADVLSGTAPLAVQFTDLSTGGPTAWIWYLGDGSQSNLQNPSIIYAAPGDYTIVLQVDNACGSDVTSKITYIHVTAPAPPVADFSGTPTSGCAPLEVQFTDASTGDITSWAWDFGDGATDTLQNPLHTFVNAGSYDVGLTVTGPGGFDNLTLSAMVTVSGPPTAAFAMSDTTGTAPLMVTFSDLSTGGPTAWAWDFGDASTDTVQNPVHTYTAAGAFTATLIAGNACGADTTSLLVQVDPVLGPVAAFSATPTSGCSPVAVNFTDESTGSITGWNWDFGDATGDTVQNPSHNYNTAGSYDVRLIVFGTGGNDTLTVPAMVTVDSMVTAAFDADAVEGGNPFNVTFTDQSTGGPTSWLWDFGDGATDTLQSPSHTYTVSGTYSVSLTATGPCGSDSILKTDLILVHTASGVGDIANARFELAGAYPNPFNPTTTIAFSLAHQSHARLEVFDPSGRRLAVLVDDTMGPGDHRVTWQPFNQSSGVYFARLTAEGHTAVTRMVLVR